MTCAELARSVHALQPEMSTRDVARLCLLLTNFCDDLDALADPGRLESALREVLIRLGAAGDQHSAMCGELETLLGRNPEEFTNEEIWGLVRAVRVHSQMLQFYAGVAVSSA